MTTHEKALITYQALEKRKQQKKDQLKRDLQNSGWNGYKKFQNRELKRFY